MWSRSTTIPARPAKATGCGGASRLGASGNMSRSGFWAPTRWTRSTSFWAISTTISRSGRSRTSSIPIFKNGWRPASCSRRRSGWAPTFHGPRTRTGCCRTRLFPSTVLARQGPWTLCARVQPLTVPHTAITGSTTFCSAPTSWKARTELRRGRCTARRAIRRRPRGCRSPARCQPSVPA